MFKFFGLMKTRDYLFLLERLRETQTALSMALNTCMTLSKEVVALREQRNRDFEELARRISEYYVR